MPINKNWPILEFDLEVYARNISYLAHLGQTRKNGFTPYIEHPKGVVAILSTVPCTKEMRAAAWLHDVVEDCDISLEDLRYRFLFPEPVVEMVDELTSKEDCKRLRTPRKVLEAIRLSTVSKESKTIKLADVIYNMQDLEGLPPEFRERFMEEKKMLLPFLEGGDLVLMYRANKIIEDYFQ